MTEFAQTHCFSKIDKVNACKIDLVTIGRNIEYKFGEILGEHLPTIGTIIIENQIGPIANKMKTIQGMLAQYFIMKNNNISIDFISATNKLKDFMPPKSVVSSDTSLNTVSNTVSDKDPENWTTSSVRNSASKLAPILSTMITGSLHGRPSYINIKRKMIYLIASYKVCGI